MRLNILWQLLLFAGTSQQVDFWVRTAATDGGCEVSGCGEAGGGMCAYAPDVDQHWCCNPNESYCWGFAQTCVGSRGSTSQIYCSNAGYNWCCNKQYESCTTATGQINVCVAVGFDSPVAAGPASLASSSTSRTSSISSSLSPSSSSSSSLSHSTTIETSSGTTSAGSNSPTPNASFSSPQSSQTSNASRPSSSISPGAAAGAAIGGFAGLLVIAGGVFLIWKRRKQDNDPALRGPSLGLDVVQYPYSDSAQYPAPAPYPAQYPASYPAQSAEMLRDYSGHNESQEYKAEVGGREVPRGPYELRT